MSLTRKVSDFLSVETGASGMKNVLAASSLATAILAATIGMSAPASAGKCDAGEIHHQYNESYNDHNNMPHSDWHDDGIIHDHYCEPIVP